MTLMLLWEEHSTQHPGQIIHSYSQFCENYRRYAKRLKRSMRQIHRAGEKLFIDYAGFCRIKHRGQSEPCLISAKV